MVKTQVSNKNIWALAIQKAVEIKLLKKINSKGEAMQVLKTHLVNIENIIKNLIRLNNKKKLFQ